MKRKQFLENFILIAIALVIVQTFISELAIFLHWNIFLRNTLLLISLFFDLTFTIEFVVRSINAGRQKKLISYWIYNRGWVDFIAAVPLLLLNSGPLVFLLILKGTTVSIAAVGILNLLKVVKAIRVTRVLRLIRVMKIFGKIRNADSKMAQHHTSAVSTISVSIILLVIIVFSFTAGDPVERSFKAREAYYVDFTARVLDLKGYDKESIKDMAGQIFSGDKRIVKLFYDDESIFSRLTEEKWAAAYSDEDYIEVREGGFTLFVSIVDINSNRALNNMLIFIIIIALVVGLMFIYTRHFVQTISDVLFILNRGFRENGYSLQIKIHKEYSDHEIFRLAAFYNDKFLPAKAKRMHQNKMKMKSPLSMKDLFKFKNR